MNIFGRRRTGTGGRFRRDKNADPKNVKIPKKLRKHVDERMREAEYLEMYRSRSNMSTKALKAKIARLEAERKFKELVEAPEKARREALQKKRQARVAFAGKAVSAALDVYSKLPSEIAGRGKTGNAAAEAIKKFKMSQDKVRAFKDVPITMTKITQSGVRMGEIINGVYLPSQDDLLLHYGKKGMKWKKKKAPTPEEEIEQNDAAYHSAKKEIDRLETMLSKYKKGKGKISSVKSVQDQIDKFKESVRAYQDKDDEIRSRTGSKYQSKSPMYSETVDKKTGAKFRKYNRNFKHYDASEEILLHYGKKGMKWKKKGEGAIGIGTVGAAPAFQDKALERRAIIERLIAKEHDKSAKKTTDPRKVAIRKELKGKAEKNAKDLEKKRENMYNPYRGDKLPKKKIKHSDTSNETLLHYGKKGMK